MTVASISFMVLCPRENFTQDPKLRPCKGTFRLPYKQASYDLLPRGAGFFFVGEGRHRISGFNNIAVKIRYPLPCYPLLSSAFEQLQNARIFTKLDIRNASGDLVRILEEDEWMTAFNTANRHHEYLVM